ncbi:MAG: hypothetical protein U0M15_09235 [Bacillota bacterium]|nr:hypothetical protein [Bacillota bacterium]
MKYGNGVGYSSKFQLPEYRITPSFLARISPNLPLIISILLLVAMLFLGFFNIISWGIMLVVSGLVGIVMSILSMSIANIHRKSTLKPDREAILKKKVIVKSKSKGSVIHRLVFEFSNGSQYYLDLVNQDELFQYYNVGDRVCVHGGYTYPEKYEKLFDDKIVCISCGHLYLTETQRCRHCQLTLLK